VLLGLPLLLAGALKAAYELTLWALFRRVPLHETSLTAAAPEKGQQERAAVSSLPSLQAIELEMPLLVQGLPDGVTENPPGEEHAPQHNASRRSLGRQTGRHRPPTLVVLTPNQNGHVSPQQYLCPSTDAGAMSGANSWSTSTLQASPTSPNYPAATR
jgi:hypothetical protein